MRDDRRAVSLGGRIQVSGGEGRNAPRARRSARPRALLHVRDGRVTCARRLSSRRRNARDAAARGPTAGRRRRRSHVACRIVLPAAHRRGCRPRRGRGLAARPPRRTPEPTRTARTGGAERGCRRAHPRAGRATGHRHGLGARRARRPRRAGGAGAGRGAEHSRRRSADADRRGVRAYTVAGGGGAAPEPAAERAQRRPHRRDHGVGGDRRSAGCAAAAGPVRQGRLTAGAVRGAGQSGPDRTECPLLLDASRASDQYGVWGRSMPLYLMQALEARHGGTPADDPSPYAAPPCVSAPILTTPPPTTRSSPAP